MKTLYGFSICFFLIFTLTSINKSSISPSSIDFKTVHDEYCDWVTNTITSWRKKGVLNESKIQALWGDMVKKLSQTLNISEKEVIEKFANLNISSKNYTKVYDDKYTLLTKNQKAFIDDLESTFLENFNKSDNALLLALDSKKEYWKNILPADAVDSTIEIAKSSFVYWKNNLDKILPENPSRVPECRKRAAARIGLSDVSGGIWGSFGGPAGALMGAVGGTLGGAISVAVFGDGC